MRDNSAHESLIQVSSDDKGYGIFTANMNHSIIVENMISKTRQISFNFQNLLTDRNQANESMCDSVYSLSKGD